MNIFTKGLGGFDHPLKEARDRLLPLLFLSHHITITIMEIWKDIKGHEGIYQVSSYSRIKSLYRKFIRCDGRSLPVKERILTPAKDRKGYMVVCLSSPKISRRVHRIVAEAFVKNPDNYECINHIDCNKENNLPENLEWCTNQMNMDHARKNGLFDGVNPVGENHHMSKLNELQVRIIRKLEWEISSRKLAKIFGVNRTTIRRTQRGLSWKHLTLYN